jgi:hypothetical protein
MAEESFSPCDSKEAEKEEKAKAKIYPSKACPIDPLPSTRSYLLVSTISPQCHQIMNPSGG